MRTGRPKAVLELSQAERTQLQAFVRSRSLPAALGLRARIVLASADGEDNKSIAARLKLHKVTVGKWRASFSRTESPVCMTECDRARQGQLTMRRLPN